MTTNEQARIPVNDPTANALLRERLAEQERIAQRLREELDDVYAHLKAERARGVQLERDIAAQADMIRELQAFIGGDPDDPRVASNGAETGGGLAEETRAIQPPTKRFTILGGAAAGEGEDDGT